MVIIARVLLLIFICNTLAHAQPVIDSAYAHTKVRFERTNASETATAVFDKNGKLLGKFYGTPIEVPVDDKTIAASISPGGDRIMSEVLPQGMLYRNTPNGPMVRVLASDFSKYVAEKNQFGFQAIPSTFGPSEDFYVPLSEFQNNKLRVIGLKEGADTKSNQVYSRFLNAIGEPSGSYVLLDNDLDNDKDLTPAPSVSRKDFAVYPPSCDCAMGSCPIASVFGPRGAPVKGASTFHRGLISPEGRAQSL